MQGMMEEYKQPSASTSTDLSYYGDLSMAIEENLASLDNLESGVKAVEAHIVASSMREREKERREREREAHDIAMPLPRWLLTLNLTMIALF